MRHNTHEVADEVKAYAKLWKAVVAQALTDATYRTNLMAAQMAKYGVCDEELQIDLNKQYNDILSNHFKEICQGIDLDWNIVYNFTMKSDQVSHGGCRITIPTKAFKSLVSATNIEALQ